MTAITKSMTPLAETISVTIDEPGRRKLAAIEEMQSAGGELQDAVEELQDAVGEIQDAAEELQGLQLDAEITVGAEDANAIPVTIQLKDGLGDDLAVRGAVHAYLSDDANGDSIAATAPSSGWAIGTDGLLIPLVANKAALLVSEEDGDIDLAITEAGAATWYLVLVMPDGRLIVSDAITFVVE